MRILGCVVLTVVCLLVAAVPCLAADVVAPKPEVRPVTPKPCVMQSLYMLQTEGMKFQAERLKLTEDQKTKLDEVTGKSDDALKPLIEAQRKASQDYAALLIKPDARVAEVKTAAEAAVKAEGAILAERVNRLFAIRALLTPEQLAEFNSNLEMQTRIWRMDNPGVPQPRPAAPKPAGPAQPAQPAAPISPAAPSSAKNWVTSPSGLEYADIKAGTGSAAKAGDVVTVQYKGWLDNGTVFDTSRQPGRQAFAFKLGAGQVIKGWDEGVAGMKAGGVRELKIPPALGYGGQDMGNIPANSTLHFEVELIKIGD